VLPYGVGRYERGRDDSLGVPLYVIVGLGTCMIAVRVNCRPEITVVQI
jgi:predicted MPP superfamily phosphohydrolase